jgi:hypothetical protein
MQTINDTLTVGSRPVPERLCTDTAKNPAPIEWVYQRSIRNAQ